MSSHQIHHSSSEFRGVCSLWVIALLVVLNIYTPKSESASVVLGLVSILTLVNLVNMSSMHWPIVHVENSCHPIVNRSQHHPTCRPLIIITLVNNIGKFWALQTEPNYSRFEQKSRTCPCRVTNCNSLLKREIIYTLLRFLNCWWVEGFDDIF